MLKASWKKAALCAASSVLIAASIPGSTALAAADPVAEGKLTLQLSKGFQKELKRNRVSMTPTSFTLKSGAIDPVTGTGTVGLPDLRLKRGTRKVTFKNVTATLGAEGEIRSKGMKIFALSAGKPVRVGFGGRIEAMSAKLTKGAVKKLGRKLDVSGLRPRGAGAAGLTYSPQTVEVTAGRATLKTFSATHAGSVASKLTGHCVHIASGAGQITPIAPATSDGANPPTFSFPITGGWVNPDGSGGVLNFGGGLRLRNNNVGGCTGMGLTSIEQTDLVYNIGERNVKARVVIGGRSATPMGDQGSVYTSLLDNTGLSTSIDPVNRTVTATGGVMSVNGASALYFNTVFPQPTFNLAGQFRALDRLGGVDLSLAIR